MTGMATTAEGAATTASGSIDDSAAAVAVTAGEIGIAPGSGAGVWMLSAGGCEEPAGRGGSRDSGSTYASAPLPTRTPR